MTPLEIAAIRIMTRIKARLARRAAKVGIYRRRTGSHTICGRR